MPEWPRLRLGALLRALAEGGVDFVIVGGIAAVAHGSPQFTRDLDITYAGDAANLERLGAVLVSVGATLRGVAEEVPFIPDGRTLRHTRVLTLVTPDGPLDLVAQADGSSGYAHLRANAITARVGGVDVLIAGLDDIISMKKATGRRKDELYIEELEAIRRLRAG